MFCGLLLVLLTFEDPEPAPPEDVWTRLAREHVDQYRLMRQSNPQRDLERIETPVSQHVQSVRGNATGSVYVWRDETGRPAAICDVFFLPRRGDTFALHNEWHSLSGDSLRAVWNGSTHWEPGEPGLLWNAVTDAAAPAQEKTRRTLQLRQLSRRFSAHIVMRNEERYELRMLPTPIFRYETTVTDNSLGGAIFAFCQGNDPETLLVIEARQHDDAYRWEFAAVEFSNMPQFVQLDGNVVWTADPPQFSRTGRHHGGKLHDVEVAPQERKMP